MDNMRKIFVDSIKRLYEKHMISEEKVIELYKNKTITEDEKEYVLNAH